jgi:hypothetical protein
MPDPRMLMDRGVRVSYFAIIHLKKLKAKSISGRKCSIKGYRRGSPKLTLLA